MNFILVALTQESFEATCCKFYTNYIMMGLLTIASSIHPSYSILYSTSYNYNLFFHPSPLYPPITITPPHPTITSSSSTHHHHLILTHPSPSPHFTQPSPHPHPPITITPSSLTHHHHPILTHPSPSKHHPRF